MDLNSDVKMIEFENYDSQEKSSLSVLSFEKFVPFEVKRIFYVNNAFKVAKINKIHTVGLLGKGGGEAGVLVDNAILIPSQSTARIQEMHITIGHILCDLIEEGLGINS